LTKPLELALCFLLERRQVELVDCESAILGAANDVLLQYVETACVIQRLPLGTKDFDKATRSFLFFA